VDRNNPRVSNLYDNLHPAVLRALMQVVAGAHRENKPVSVCGEMAADPASSILLLAMGFDMLSMNPNSLPRIKWVVRSFTLKRAKELLEEVLVMEDPLEIRGHLEAALDEAGLGGLIRAGQ
jgi:phosphotransferase system enzyme I (PtsP)